MKIADRIRCLRREMEREGIDIYIVPSADYHGSEYVGEYFKTRQYLTGFTGSAGTAVFTRDKAGLWTDGRYFIQAEETESKSSGFSSETVKAEIDEILAIADKKQLMSFLSEYAVHHVDFRNALKQQFIPDRNTESLDTDYCQEVERCFLSSPSGSGYGRTGRFVGAF